jgi:hypothetical protein
MTMVAEFNGAKQNVKKEAAKPTGEAVKTNAKVIETPYSKAKQEGGTASLGGGIGNS